MPFLQNIQNRPFKNHQGWEIVCGQDSKTGGPLFYLRDPFGMESSTTAFIIGDPAFVADYQQASSSQQLPLLHEYFQCKLSHNNPYRVHIEKRHDLSIVRFGDYGVKGGVNFSDLRHPQTAGTAGSLLLTIAAIFTAIILPFTITYAIVLAIGGFMGSIYGVRTKKEDYSPTEQGKQIAKAMVGALILNGTGALFAAADPIAQLTTLGVAGGLEKVVLHSEVHKQTTWRAAIKEGACKFGMGMMETGAGSYLGMLSIQGCRLGAATFNLSKDVTGSIITKISTTAFAGAVEGTTEAVVDNFAAKKRGIKLLDNVVPAALTGAAIRAVQMGVRAVNRTGGITGKKPSSPQGYYLDTAHCQGSSVIRRSIRLIPDISHLINILCTPFIPLECQDEQELIQHAVVVHAIHQDYFIPKNTKFYETNDPDEKAAICIEEIVIDGYLGHHLDFENKVFQSEDIIDRPHLHISLGQLVQPHSNGNWEEARIAILEPLSAIENDEQGLYNIATFDLMLMRKHQLSPEAVILVPQPVFERVKNHFEACHFVGKIVPYEGTLRPAVMRAIKEQYAYLEPWLMCDKEGNEIGHEEHETKVGYQKETWIKTHQGEVLRLFAGDGANEDQCSPAMNKWRRGRYMGLHMGAATDLIEKDAIGCIKALNKILCRNWGRLSESEKQLLVGYIGENESLIPELSIYKVFDFVKAHSFDVKTNFDSYKDYLLCQAFFADMVSMFISTQEADTFNLFLMDMRLIFDPLRLNLFKKMVEKIYNDKSLEAINEYCAALQFFGNKMLEAKEQTENFLKEIENEKGKEKRRNESSLVEQLIRDTSGWTLSEQDIPAEFEFSFEGLNQLSENLNNYVKRIFKIIKAECESIEELKELHENLIDEMYQSNDRETQFRLSVIREVVRLIIQLMHYSNNLNK